MFGLLAKSAFFAKWPTFFTEKIIINEFCQGNCFSRRLDESREVTFSILNFLMHAWSLYFETIWRLTKCKVKMAKILISDWGRTFKVVESMQMVKSKKLISLTFVVTHKNGFLPLLLNRSIFTILHATHAEISTVWGELHISVYVLDARLTLQTEAGHRTRVLTTTPNTIENTTKGN